MNAPVFTNPFRPGAGHMPPYLAGREHERREFFRLLQQQTILENTVLTGLRGVGKTVLLESLKPLAIAEGWHWVGTDLSESTSVSEDSLATRLITDLSVVGSGLVLTEAQRPPIGFTGDQETVRTNLDSPTLKAIYEATPGLVADKLKTILEITWATMQASGARGIIFAYDEAQNLADHAEKEQFPLSLLLDVFQSIQRKGIPFMLVLTGLPTLFPKLVEARTYAERMFRVLFLAKLSDGESRDAIEKPVKAQDCPVKLSPDSVSTISLMSGGYPYFIQFICREVYDIFVQQARDGAEHKVPTDSIIGKLDTDFFAGRWARATDRQRELMAVIASLPNCDQEFTTQEVSDRSKKALSKGFSPSHVNQMLASLGEQGLVYKNRYGKYSFAVPMFGDFVRRQMPMIAA